MDLEYISQRFPLLVIVFLALLLQIAFSQTPGPQNLVYFDGTATVTTNAIFSPQGQVTLQFRTCTGGELFSQTDGDQMIAVSINETGSINIRWNSGSGVMETSVGQGFNDNLWTIIDFVYVGESLVLRVRDEAIELATVIKNPTLLNLVLSSTMVVGTGFTGCIEEIVGIDFANAVSWPNARWGECPLDEDIGCGAQDPCTSQPCMNNGVCSSDQDGFSCQCTSRFNGTTCENDLGDLCINPSFTLNCVNGACTEDGVSNTTFCNCSQGYGGPLCNTASTLCDNNPCGNSGYCQTNAAVDGIICLCFAGYTGSECDVEINDCEVNPCLNGGACQDLINSYGCDCTDTGYSGSRCETNDNECQENDPCQNGAACSDTNGGYYCSCTAGNIGSNCEDNLCSLNPCENGATCSVNEGNINCTCAGGIEGERCEVDIDECASNPCQNGGVCVDRTNAFECFCSMHYTGTLCQVELDVCGQPELFTCLNGATCVDQDEGYTCTCVPGFTDDDCGTNIDECASSPCTNNATCVDEINRYRCKCAAGFNGTECQFNIDECASNPCQNNGVCNDEVNGFVCNCSDTGFDGPYCTNNIDDCISNPCQNEGTCLDGIKFYNCSCYLGYEGINCEVDINECNSQPCQNGATCLQLSDESLYQEGNPYSDYVPDSFSYANASGYVCVCQDGYEGANCEVNIDECVSNPCTNGATCNDDVNRFDCQCVTGYDGVFCENDIDECSSNPCENGATCQDNIGAFSCRCVEGFGDTRCDVVLTACIDNTQCLNGATCKPYYTQGAHGFDCICSAGYTGDFCAIDTSASFYGTDQYLTYTFVSDLPFQFSFSFATTIRSGHLLLSFSIGDSLNVEMVDGSLSVTIIETISMESVTLVNITGLGTALNDGEWHDVEINLINPGSIEVNVTSDSCPDNICSEMGSFSSTLSQFNSIHFGHVPDNYAGPVTNDAFTGCMRDVKQTSTNDFVLPVGDLVSGCSRTPQCDPDPCNGQGECTDLWWTYTCQCQLGYTGPSCETSFVQGTFSFENTTSFAMFDTSGYALSKSENTIRLIFRTRQEYGLLLYTGAGSDYIVLTIDNSSVVADVSFAGSTDNLMISGSSVSDGRYHSLEFSRVSTTLSFNLDSSLPETVNLASSSEPSFDQIYVGGVDDFSDGSLPAPVSTSMYFKGCLWDIKYNNYSLEFFPLDIADFQIDSIPVFTNSNVISMCNSDNTCDPEPCENEGVCEITWNDFQCDCPNGFGGKNCSEETICSRNPCPGGAACLDRDDGYECLTPATFSGSGSLIKYNNSLNISREINTITFRLRTRRDVGLIMHSSNSLLDYFFTIDIQDSKLSVRFFFGSQTRSLGTVYEIIPDYLVSDGVWHDVVITFASPEVIVAIDNVNVTEVITFRGGVNDVLGDGSSGIVYLGGTDFSNDDYFEVYSSFEGNLDDVRIGTYLLPFFNQTVYNATNEEQFYAISIIDVTSGDAGPDVCSSSPCLNGGNCTDQWNAFACICIPGYTGDYCETDINECDPDPCQFDSTCFDLVNGYNCSCRPGYEGTNCSMEIDECASDPCQNDGTCTDGIAMFTCTCPTEFTGRMCEFNVSATCDNDPCLNGGTCTSTSNSFTCACVAGYEGERCAYETDYCASIICQNGATCVSDRVSLTYDCQCVTGFSGDLCETNINDCQSDSCDNGVCVDGLNEFSCDCTSGYTGQRCEIEIDECSSNPCYAGTCNNLVDRYTCSCPDSYEGTNCQYAGPCLNLPCQNGGTCSQTLDQTDNSFTYQCTCPTGFNDTDCQNEIQWCDSNPCQQEGSNCTDDRFGFICSCAPGYGGTVCETKLPDCSDNLCLNGANCTDLTYGYRCTCVAGYTGDNCQTDIDECVDNQCANGATCLDLVNDYDCDCEGLGFQGTYCQEDILECSASTNPCSNGGTCMEEYGSYKCECVAGYLGPQCLTMDPCFTEDICQNGGTCVLLDETIPTYECDCVDGYTGDNCENAPTDIKWIIIGASIAAAVVIIILIVLLSCFVCSVRKKRATQGSYSPSRQEMTGSFVEMDNVLKMPPEERLI